MINRRFFMPQFLAHSSTSSPLDFGPWFWNPWFWFWWPRPPGFRLFSTSDFFLALSALSTALPDAGCWVLLLMLVLGLRSAHTGNTTPMQVLHKVKYLPGSFILLPTSRKVYQHCRIPHLLKSCVV